MPEIEYIKIPDLKDGYLYRISAGNASYGIWRKEMKGFFISRTKWGLNFLDKEFHWDFAFFPTVRPLEEIEKAEVDFKDEKTMLTYLNKFEDKLQEKIN